MAPVTPTARTGRKVVRGPAGHYYALVDDEPPFMLVGLPINRSDPDDYLPPHPDDTDDPFGPKVAWYQITDPMPDEEGGAEADRALLAELRNDPNSPEVLEWRRALSAWQAATMRLSEAWDGLPVEVEGYPTYLPSFDEFALDAQAIEFGRVA
jgi:hypothetical protein